MQIAPFYGEIVLNNKGKCFQHINENKTENDTNWPYIPDHPYRILIIGGSGSGKTKIIKLNRKTTRY